MNPVQLIQSTVYLSGVGISKGTTPVVSFGDYSTAKIATIGINPSIREFKTSKGKLLDQAKKRLTDHETLGIPLESKFYSESEAELIWQGCKNYFHTRNTYWSWFNQLEELLQHVGASYKHDATHLDITPWTTEPVWSKLDSGDASKLLGLNIGNLNAQIEDSGIQTILFNGRQVYTHIDHHLNWYLKKVGELKYSAGGKKQTSDLILGDGPKGRPVIGWSINLQSAKLTKFERSLVVSELKSFIKSNSRIN